MSKKQLWIVGFLMAACVAVGVFIASDFKAVPFGLAAPDVKLGADAPPVSPTNEIRVLNDAFVAVSKAVTDQVVAITVTSKGRPASSQDEEDPFDPFGMFQFKSPQPSRGSGSGVIITQDGYILTNNHVVESAAEGGGIEVDLHDGRHFDATVIGRDPLTDLAVIRIEATGLSAAALGNSDEAQVGQIVLAVGNPLGLNSTVTQGIVSALGRGQLNLNTNEQGYGVEDFIQTDAAINPGNSGGGLFDLRGALIGINAAIASRTGYYQGYGFAIPINLARSVAQDIIEDGKINRGYIGVRIEAVNQSLRKALGLGNRDGVLIQETMPGSSAAAAGLKQGDVILQVDGISVRTPNHLQNLVAQKRSGQQVKLTIYRDGQTFDRNVSLKPKEEEAEEEISTISRDRSERSGEDESSSVSIPSVGMDVKTLDAQGRKRSGVDKGAEVTATELYGEASSQGIARGDVIVGANRKQIASAADLKRIMEDASPGDVVLLQVKGRSGATRLVAVEVKP